MPKGELKMEERTTGWRWDTEKSKAVRCYAMPLKVEAEIVELYKNGNSLREISRMGNFGSRTAISSCLKRNGVKLRKSIEVIKKLNQNKEERFLKIKAKEWGFDSIEEARTHFEVTGVNRGYLEKYRMEEMKDGTENTK